MTMKPWIGGEGNGNRGLAAQRDKSQRSASRRNGWRTHAPQIDVLLPETADGLGDELNGE